MFLTDLYLVDLWKLEAKKIFCLVIEDMSASQNVNPGHPHSKVTMYKGATIEWHCKEALFWERDPSALSLCPLILSNELPMCVILFGWCNCFWSICTLVYILREKVVFGALKNINCWFGEFHSWKIVSGKKTCLGNTFKGDAGESNEITTTRVHKYQRSPQEPSFLSGHPGLAWVASVQLGMIKDSEGGLYFGHALPIMKPI